MPEQQPRKALVRYSFSREYILYSCLLLLLVWQCFAYPPSGYNFYHHGAFLLCGAAMLLLEVVYVGQRLGAVRRPGWMAIAAIGFIAALGVVQLIHPAWMQNRSLLLLLCMLPACALMPLAQHLTRGLPQSPVNNVTTFALIAACVLGVFNYYKRADIREVNDFYDVAYYYTNSKYFNELGYDYLYPAYLMADEETVNALRNVREVRNLATDRRMDRDLYVTFELKQLIRARFTNERWESFKADYLYLSPKMSGNIWRDLFTDHGYNPPATWTVVGGTLANLVPIQYMKYLTMIDFGLVSLMFLAIYRAFGLETCLIALLWFTVSFSGRAPVLGQALLRFDWVSCLVMGVCMLALGRPMLAGALMGYAGLVRVFPLVFFWPYLADAACTLSRERKLNRGQLRFLLGAVLVGVILLTGILARHGAGAIPASIESLKLHAASYTSHRVGLGAAVFFQFERTDRQIVDNGGIAGKKQAVAEAKPIFYFIFVAYLGLIAFHTWRVRPPLHRSVHWSMIPLFVATNAQVGYYTMRLLLVIWHASDIRKYRHKFGLTLLFLIEALAHYTYLRDWPRYTVNASTSVLFAGYFLFLSGILVYEILHTYGYFESVEEVAPIPSRPTPVPFA